MDIYVAEQILKGNQAAEEAAAYVIKAEEAAKKLRELVPIQRNYNRVSSAIEGCNADLLRYKDIDEAIARLNKANSDLGVRSQLCQLLTEYGVFEEKVSTASHEVVEKENRAAELEGAFRDELISLEMCPLCGSEVDPENIKEVV